MQVVFFVQRLFVYCNRPNYARYLKLYGVNIHPKNEYALRPEACNFIKKETLAQVFSCEFYEITKNTFSYRTPPVTTSNDVCSRVIF